MKEEYNKIRKWLLQNGYNNYDIMKVTIDNIAHTIESYQEYDKNQNNMKTVKVKAIFKGLNNSCGYKTDVEYTLIIRHKRDLNIYIEDVNGERPCEYNTILLFLENWDNIRVIVANVEYLRVGSCLPAK